MALIVEDGTGLATAESYVSVADATTYHANRGNTAWAAVASDTVREQLLRKATEYLDNLYGTRWKGSVINATQALDWPRVYVVRDDYGGFIQSQNYYAYYPSDEVPQAIKNATCEAALSAISTDLLAEQGQVVKREKVDVLEVEYDNYSPQRRRFPTIEALLKPFLMGGNKAVRV